MLIDNTWPSRFDFGKTVGDYVQYRAEGGPAEHLHLYGPSAKEVTEELCMADGANSAASAVDAWVSAVPLQLHAQARVLEVATGCAKTRFLPTPFISTSITRKRIDRSPSTKTLSGPGRRW